MFSAAGRSAAVMPVVLASSGQGGGVLARAGSLRAYRKRLLVGYIGRHQRVKRLSYRSIARSAIRCSLDPGRLGRQPLALFVVVQFRRIDLQNLGIINRDPLVKILDPRHLSAAAWAAMSKSNVRRAVRSLRLERKASVAALGPLGWSVPALLRRPWPCGHDGNGFVRLVPDGLLSSASLQPGRSGGRKVCHGGFSSICPWPALDR